MADTEQRRPAWWPWLLLLAAWTAWIDLGRFHGGTNADTVIPVLVSVLKWTPFFWEQDRYGMLVPLLATPIHHPLTNLVFQSALTIFAGLLCFFVVARFFFRGSAWPAISIAALGWLVLFSDSAFPYAWLSITMFYGPALVLGLGAFLVVEGSRHPLRHWPRWTLALVLMVLAHWINFSIGIMLLLLFSGRAMADPTRESNAGSSGSHGWKGALRARLDAHLDARLLLLGAGVVAGRVIMGVTPLSWRSGDAYGALPPRLWLQAWTTALGNRDYGIGPWVTYVVLPVAIGLLVRWKVPRARAGSRAAPALAGIAAAIVYGLAVQATKQAMGGGFPGRYLVPSAGIICVLGVGVGIDAVWPLLTSRLRRHASLAVAGASTLAVLVRFGAPSWSNVRASLDERLGERTEELLSANCTHVIGWYYYVWPSVLHTLIRLRDAGDQRIIWGIGSRAMTTMPAWRAGPAERLKLCTGKEHLEDVDVYAAAFGLPHLSVVEELTTIRVLDGDKAALRAWVK